MPVPVGFCWGTVVSYTRNGWTKFCKLLQIRASHVMSGKKGARGTVGGNETAMIGHVWYAVIGLAAVALATVLNTWIPTMENPKSATIREQFWLDTKLVLTKSDTVRCCDVPRRHINSITPKEWKQVLNGRTPLILQGVMDNWPALTKWKDDNTNPDP